MSGASSRAGERADAWALAPWLTRAEAQAARLFVARVRREVGAVLEQASLFGSKARGEARPDSDLDILLVFHWLPDDREPQASEAEDLADQVAQLTGIPVTAWSVSLIDLQRGRRTPMLVDALADSVPLWWARSPLPRIDFTVDDALWCADRLLYRVEEGSEEFAARLSDGDGPGAARRARDDLVRLCTALLLLRGETRPRRGEAVERALATALDPRSLSELERRVFDWVRRSYGPAGRDDDTPVGAPPAPVAVVTRLIDRLRDQVWLRADRLEGRRRWAWNSLRQRWV